MTTSNPITNRHEEVGIGAKARARGSGRRCGTEEKPCPVSRVSPPASIPATSPAKLPEKAEDVRLGVDFYSQAVKTLSERSPFDSNEVLANTVATLPSGLASLLFKHSDSKKKHKRPHSETKSSRKGATEKAKGSAGFWIGVEDYFREVTLQDIERLNQFSSSFGSLLNSSDTCFQIPALGNACRNSITNNGDVNKLRNGHAGDVPAALIKVEEEEKEEVLDGDSQMSDAGALEDKEEVDREKGMQHNVKMENGNRDSLGVVEEGPSPEYSSQSCSSVEWVLGSRNRALLTTTRPSKKRKLSGDTSALERLIVAQPCEGSSSICHVCSMGDTRDQLNKLVVCRSCNVVVHQKCYGVQGEVDGPWFCSWCKYYRFDAQAGPAVGRDRPCVFCPKSGGALKRYQNTATVNEGPGHAELRFTLHVQGRQKINLKFGEGLVVMKDSVGTLNEPAVVSGNKIKKLKIGCKNGDKVTFNLGAPDGKCHNLGERVWQDTGLKDSNPNAKVKSGSGEGQKLSDMDLGGAGEDVKTSCLLNLGLVLKKVNNFSRELYCKILNWLKDHSYLDTSEKDWRARLSCLIPSKAELRTDDDADAVALRDLDITDVPVKSVPPRRRTVGNKEDKVISLWNTKLHDNGVSTKEGTEQEDMIIDHDNASKDSIGRMEEIMVETNGFEPPSTEPSPISETEDGASSGKSSLLDLDQETPSCSSVDMVGCCDGYTNPGIDSSVHPYIQRKMDQVQSWLIRKSPDSNGSAEKELPVCIDEDGGSEGVKLEDLSTADAMDILDLSPENEVEGEIIFFQQQLLRNAVALKHQSDRLFCKVVRDLPHEIDTVRKRRWDSVRVNQYMYELKEARKQGRKERRHKEAQAVLAAATAAAAASSRVSSLRKDVVDESPQQEVAVHLNCYRSVKESTGPWYCELCEESSSSKSRAAVASGWAKPNSDDECGLCGASNGALRKSSNGQWVHAFCAEWVFDSTYRRGQVSPVAGMVELEKLRLLCERIIKREKLKRELVICNQDIVGSRRDSLVVSMLVHRPPFSSLESSDSATTSLKDHIDGSRSCSDAMQRSDDITVDSALSAKRCIRPPQAIDNDRKTEDSSTSHHRPTPKPGDRVSFAGKQIPMRAALASRNLSHGTEDLLLPKKHLETFEKELVMTSDQASLKNRRLPKGYIYVPIDYLSNRKPVSRDSVEEDEVDE
ncbi:PHD finger protein rhinoceros [Bienertia sinuspersici]